MSVGLAYSLLQMPWFTLSDTVLLLRRTRKKVMASVLHLSEFRTWYQQLHILKRPRVCQGFGVSGVFWQAVQAVIPPVLCKFKDPHVFSRGGEGRGGRQIRDWSLVVKHITYITKYCEWSTCLVNWTLQCFKVCSLDRLLRKKMIEM